MQGGIKSFRAVRDWEGFPIASVRGVSFVTGRNYNDRGTKELSRGVVAFNIGFVSLNTLASRVSEK